MSNKSKGQDLIAAFLEAVRLRHLDRCREILNSAEAFAEQSPEFEPWRRYMNGYLTFEQHRWAEAEQIFTELLQTDLEPTLHGRVIYALGRNYDIQGRWQEALAAFEQYLSIVTELDQPVEQARAWNHLASSLYAGFMKGDFSAETLPQAIAYSQAAVAVLEPIPEPPPDIAYLKGAVWNNLGLMYVSLNQWDEAITCYEQDLAICQAQNDRFGMGITYGNIGEVYLKLHKWPEAIAAHQQALDLIRQFGGRYEEIDILANLAFLYQKMGDHPTALDYYGRTIDLIESLRAGVSSETVQAGFFATVIDTYANTVHLCLEMGREELAFNYVERARSRAFLDTLIARSPHGSQNVETYTITLSEVQAALPADALLLEYFTTGLVEAQESQAAAQQVERHRFPPSRTLVFAVVHDAVQVHDTGLSPNALRPEQLGKIVERHFLKPEIRRKLYDQFIAPVEPLLQDKRRLYLAPHGPLHYIPFQALLAPDGDTLLRDGGPQLIYAPSAAVLFRYGRVSAGQAPLPCLALGYNSQGRTRLRFAEAEARSIARLTGGQAIVGSTPKKAALYNRAAAYRLLHLVCHGEFDPESPLASFLHLAPGETLTALEALENLQLQCDLVTLSACESGLNRVRRGDELVGFSRAFMAAGASALVATLWRVDDYPTSILMKRFYQEIQAGAGFSEALKQAQLFVKNLTYQEALRILTTLADDQTGETSASPAPAPKRFLEHPEPALTFPQAISYLRGVAGRKRPDTAETPPTAPAPDEKVYEDPEYWAAFVLIGAHDA